MKMEIGFESRLLLASVLGRDLFLQAIPKNLLAFIVACLVGC